MVINYPCDKCGSDQEEYLDWDYDEAGNKFEYSDCQNCGNHNEYHQ